MKIPLHLLIKRYIIGKQKQKSTLSRVYESTKANIRVQITNSLAIEFVYKMTSDLSPFSQL